jgi:NADH-quinone oxidoreductase subunit J
LILTVVVLAMALIVSVWTVLSPGLMRSAFGLACLSVLATALIFMLGAELAAVFELSVCAGLITVVFVCTISMTQPASKIDHSHEAKRNPLRRYAFLPALVLAAGAIVFLLTADLSVAPLPPAAALGAREVLWGERRTDLLGQVVILLAGVLGVIVLFKERRK